MSNTNTTLSAHGQLVRKIAEECDLFLGARGLIPSPDQPEGTGK